MKKDKDRKTHGGILRHSVEELLRPEKQEDTSSPGEAQHTRRLLHELHACGNELETQNEGLRRAQQEVEDSREMYADLYDSAPVGYLTLDEKGLISGLNSTAAKLLGIERNCLVNKPFSDFVYPGYRKLFRSHMENIVRSALKQTCALALKGIDGTPFHVQLESVAVAGEGGVSIRTVIEDVTLLKQAREALRESENRFRAIADFAYDCECFLDTRGKLVWINAAVFRLTGYTVEECMAMTGFPVSVVLEDDRMRVARFFAGALRGMTGNDQEFRLRRKDGSLQWASVSWQPVRDVKGSILGNRASVRDIAERKAVEEQLRKEHERLELAQRAAGAGIWYWDIETDQMEWSPRLWEIFGLDPQESVASFDAWNAFLHPDDREMANLRVRAALRERTDLIGEYRIVRRDKQVRWIRVMGKGIYGERGQPMQMTGICIDITEQKTFEDVALEREELFTRIFQESPFGMVMAGPDFRFIRANAAFCKMLGYTEEELIPLSFKDITHPDHLAEDVRLTNDLAGGKIPFYRTEKRYVRKDKKAVWGATAVSVMRDRNHRFLYFLATIEDITRRKRMEARLRHSHDQLELRILERTAELQSAYDNLAENERLYRNLFENASIGMFQSRFDGTGFLRINKAYATMLGYDSPEEVMSTIVNTATQIHGDPKNREELLAALEKDEWYYAEQPYLRKDGSVMTGKISARKVLNPDGTPAYLEGIIEDITERKKTEQVLQESEEKYRSVVEGNFVGFYIVQDKVFTFVNEGFCKITGYRYDELVGKLWPVDLTHPDDKEKVMANLERRISGGIDHVEYSGKSVRKDGGVIYLKIFGKSLVYNGRPAAAGTIIDVTRERALEAQLIRAQKLEAIGTLAGGIAHDFNNILAGIMGFTEMVQEDMAPESPGYQRLELVLKGARRGRDLVEQILTFGRRNEHAMEMVSLGEVVKESLKLLRPLIPSTIEIRSQVPAGQDMIEADPSQIHQALINLCTNGAQAMAKKGGVLEISVTRRLFESADPIPVPEMTAGDYLILKVRDTGTGIKPEIMRRIFDPFFTTKDRGKGSGLGLSVVHGIVKSHHGFINVESEPGKGSVFSIYIPKSQHQTGPVESEKVTARGGTECILFVDDESGLVQLNTARLTRLGYEVVGTTSSLEALRIFRKEPQRFHLVITDYTMPYMTGVELARRLLKIRKDIPIILWTGYNERISPDKAKRAGIREFVLKPQSTSGMDVAIRRALDARPVIDTERHIRK